MYKVNVPAVLTYYDDSLSLSLSLSLPFIGCEPEESCHFLVLVEEHWFGEEHSDLVPVGQGLERGSGQPHCRSEEEGEEQVRDGGEGRGERDGGRGRGMEGRGERRRGEREGGEGWRGGGEKGSENGICIDIL